MKKSLLPVLTLGLASLPAWSMSMSWSSIQSQSGWSTHTTKTHADAGTVQVLKKTISGIQCFKGIATTEVKPETLYNVAADIPGTRRWSTAGVKEAEVLAKGTSTLDYYQYLDVPGWTMASDRFWFLHGIVERSNGTVAFHWDRLENGGPYAERLNQVKTDHADAIEPPTNAGGWVFTPQADGNTLIEYYICTDTGGMIPGAVQNAATTKTLPDTVGDLVREGRKRGG